jgi:hypothetical protein
MRCGVDDVLRKAMPFAHWRMSASLRIVLQKSFCGRCQLFRRLLARCWCNDPKDLIATR